MHPHGGFASPVSLIPGVHSTRLRWSVDKKDMPLLPSAITSSLVQTAQAQQVAARDRDRRRAAAAETIRSRADRIELHIDGVELEAALERLPGNDSEQSHQERRENQPDGRTPSLTRIDVKA